MSFARMDNRAGDDSFAPFSAWDRSLSVARRSSRDLMTGRCRQEPAALTVNSGEAVAPPIAFQAIVCRGTRAEPPLISSGRAT